MTPQEDTSRIGLNTTAQDARHIKTMEVYHAVIGDDLIRVTFESGEQAWYKSVNEPTGKRGRPRKVRV